MTTPIYSDTIELIEGIENEKENPSRGHRSLPIYCEINFEEETISGPSILDYITDYEIWDESGESCFSVSYDGSSFVQTLKMLPTPGIYSIVLRGPDVVLSGYIQF
ncbi:MAG: hypothetical protein J1E78_02135 [Muribaculaceae bacterium]|nr:hypothetical protein [Muribaculaceae bacterium]